MKTILIKTLLFALTFMVVTTAIGYTSQEMKLAFNWVKCNPFENDIYSGMKPTIVEGFSYNTTDSYASEGFK